MEIDYESVQTYMETVSKFIYLSLQDAIFDIEEKYLDNDNENEDDHEN